MAEPVGLDTTIDTVVVTTIDTMHKIQAFLSLSLISRHCYKERREEKRHGSLGPTDQPVWCSWFTL